MKEERTLLSLFHEHMYVQQRFDRHTIAHEIRWAGEDVIIRGARCHLIVPVNKPAENDA
jgi:hypothetical protein